MDGKDTTPAASARPATAPETDIRPSGQQQEPTVSDLLARMERLEAENTQLKHQVAGDRTVNVRSQYVQSKMADVPAAYLALLGDDPQKFEEREQVIRKQLREDLQRMGVKAADVQGDAGGQPPTAAMKPDPGTAYENIMKGLGERTATATPAD